MNCTGQQLTDKGNNFLDTWELFLFLLELI